jgi:beta-glucosidase
MDRNNGAGGYRNANLPVEQRVADLLDRMTLQEKVAQVRAAWIRPTDDGDFELYERMTGMGTDARAFLRNGIGHLTRPFGTRPVDPRTGAQALNAVQRFLREETRLGIPALPHDECLSGLLGAGFTQFPCPLNYGASWDPALIEAVAGVIRRQMLAVGSRQGLAPVCDVVRDARWGRVEECVAEDPYLVGVLLSAYVRGLQGDDLGRGVLATLKHFAGHAAGEGGRNLAPVHIGPRAFADIHLLPFEMVVKTAGAKSVMSAYHDIDGVPASASHALLTGILRDAWGFEGTVVADYNAVRWLWNKHRVAADKAEAAALALAAGMDVELPGSEFFLEGLPEALARGLIGQPTLDRAVARVLADKMRLGLFENPYVDLERIAIDTAADRAVARRCAERSIVLLKNDGILPLSPTLSKVAVIGPSADDALALFGNYNAPANLYPRYPDMPRPHFGQTVLDALRDHLGADRVAHAKGCSILTGAVRRVRHPPEGPTPEPGVEIISTDRTGIAAAAAAAAAADVAIVVVGDRAGPFQTGTVGEGSDVDDLSLPGVQPDLVQSVLETGTPTVLVLLCGRPHALGPLAERAAAIVVGWFPGQEGAAAIADVLTGAVNPAGRTPVSFVASAGAAPFAYNHPVLSEGLPRAPHFGARFPFGHGLSYTRFAYSALSIAPAEVAPDGTVEIACVVENTGDRAGDEVVQLYVTDPVRSVVPPVQELKGFVRVSLAPGERMQVRFALPIDVLAFTGADLVRIVEPGAIDVGIGASSADIRLSGRCTIVGPRRTVGEHRRLITEVTRESLCDRGGQKNVAG